MAHGLFWTSSDVRRRERIHAQRKTPLATVRIDREFNTETFNVETIICFTVKASKVCNQEQMNWLNRQWGPKCQSFWVFLPLCYCIEFYLGVIHVSGVKSHRSQSAADTTSVILPILWPAGLGGSPRTASSLLEHFDKGLLTSRSRLSCQKSFNSGLLECLSSMSLRVFLSSHLHKCKYFAAQRGELCWTNHLNSARVTLRHWLEIFLFIWVPSVCGTSQSCLLEVSLFGFLWVLVDLRYVRRLA